MVQLGCSVVQYMYSAVYMYTVHVNVHKVMYIKYTYCAEHSTHALAVAVDHVRAHVCVCQGGSECVGKTVAADRWVAYAAALCCALQHFFVENSSTGI